MEIRNERLYNLIKSYMEGVCQDSRAYRHGEPQFENMVDALLKEQAVYQTIQWLIPQIKNHRTEAASWALEFSHIYQKIASGLVWDIRAFEHVYAVFENSLYSSTLTESFISGLEGLKCSSAVPVEIDKEVELKRPDERISRLLSRAGGSTLLMPWAPPDFCLYITIKTSRRHPRDNSKVVLRARNKADSIITSLRILKSGRFYSWPFLHIGTSPFGELSIGKLWHSFDEPAFKTPPSHIPFTPAPEYTLIENQIQHLLEIYLRLQHLTKNQRDILRMPLARFNDSYSRLESVERLFDLVVALERLYIRDPQELSYKLALRCAYFLCGSEPERRIDIYNKTRDAYEVRSSYAHGRALKTGLNDPSYQKEIAQCAEDCLRATIKMILLDPDTVSKFYEEGLKQIDELVASGGQSINKLRR